MKSEEIVRNEIKRLESENKSRFEHALDDDRIFRAWAMCDAMIMKLKWVVDNG
ncbi:MAG: hypothetical protein M0P69_13615 [Bacteroidales bacterium]|nr:hypothetical protein [Bacteroidales bacterium]